MIEYDEQAKTVTMTDPEDPSRTQTVPFGNDRGEAAIAAFFAAAQPEEP